MRAYFYAPTGERRGNAGYVLCAPGAAGAYTRSHNGKSAAYPYCKPRHPGAAGSGFGAGLDEAGEGDEDGAADEVPRER
jgi:hypothetical protein